MEPRSGFLVWHTVLCMLGSAGLGCSRSGDDVDAGPGPGTLVATLPLEVIPLGMASHGTLLHLLGARSDPGGVVFRVFRIQDGRIDAEPLSAVDWTDYFAGNDLTLATRFDALPGAAFLLGWQGVTVVPFDGSPSRWLLRPNLLPDGGPLTLLDGGPLRLPDGGLFPAIGFFAQASQLEADGSLLVAWEHVQVPDDTCSLGRFTPSGEWQDLTELADSCGFGTVLLADPASLYVTTNDRLWRVDRSTSSSSTLLTGLQIGAGFNSIYQLVKSEESLLFLRLLDRGAGAELDQLGPDGGIQTLESFGPSDLFISALAAEGPSIYLLSQSALRRRLASGGDEVLAQAPSNGLFGLSGSHYVRLIIGDAGVFFTLTESTDAGLVSTVRFVPR